MVSANLPRLPEHVLCGETGDLYKALNEAAPLPRVLIGVAAIDKALHSVLSRFLIDSRVSEGMLQQAHGLLGSYGARHEMAYALGLIPVEMLHNLRALGELRNKFVHSDIVLDFDSLEIGRLCDQLNVPAACEASFGDAADVSSLYVRPTRLRAPRDRFMLVTLLTFGQLLSAAMNVERRQKCTGEWA